MGGRKKDRTFPEKHASFKERICRPSGYCHEQKNRLGSDFDLFHKERVSVDKLLMGPDFFEIVRECYNRKYPNIVFSDFLWTMRSIYLPALSDYEDGCAEGGSLPLCGDGICGSPWKYGETFSRESLLISEHGIYTREREEELIKADWVKGVYKNIWIEQFKKMSFLAYEKADIVTCLYERAKSLQIELGCPEEKIRVTPNGIRADTFEGIPGKTEDDAQYINAGAVLRVTPIKDVNDHDPGFRFCQKERSRAEALDHGADG